MKQSICIFFSLFFALTVWAQKEKPADYGIKSKKALDFYLEGNQYSKLRDRAKAVENYLKAVAIEPDFADAWFPLGANYFMLKKYGEALEALEKVLDSDRKNKFVDLDFFLGEAYFYTEKYADAAAAYERFLALGKGRINQIEPAKLQVIHAKFAAEAIKQPVDFRPINLGAKVNSPGDEYLPSLTADDKTLMFTARRSECTGGYNRYYGGFTEDLFIAENQENEWTDALNIGEPINTPENDGAVSISQDGKMIFFSAGERSEGFGNLDLYYATKTEKGWSKAMNLGEMINTEFREAEPCLSHDGKTLYFSSNRRGSVGGTDIWMTTLEKGKWTAPVNLGAAINTVGEEYAPFIHADGVTLYYSSNRLPGFGAFDMFVSFNVPDSGWRKPRNLGYPLNTVADERNIFVNAQGTKGLINSFREGGFGGSDIYEFTLDPRNRPRLATFLRGTTEDSLTKQPISATIYLVEVETRDTVRQMISGKKDGRFLMSLPLEKEYAAFAEANGYIFTSKNFYLKDLPDNVYFDIVIRMMKLPPPPAKPVAVTPDAPPVVVEPVKPATPIVVVLRNIFFDFGKYELKTTSLSELGVLLNYLKENPRMKIEIQGHTDNVGKDETNLILSQNRAEAVRSYLISKGIASERVQAKGYGESQPI
ncbi:MAG: OmpA family protein, partial [Bacteroidia bacterium]